MSRRSLVVALVLVIAVVALAAQQLSVQVRSTGLRQRPSYLGPVTTELSYGTRVEVIETRGPWRHVRSPGGKTGWLHDSALSEKKLSLEAGATDAAVAADSDELALAGKGFNEQVERAYREDNPEVDYGWVERMSSWRVTPAESREFLQRGEITPHEGGLR
jgi:SH3-like domain-containing protein